MIQAIDHNPYPLCFQPDSGYGPSCHVSSFSRPQISLKVTAHSFRTGDHINGIRKLLERPEEMKGFQPAAAGEREEPEPPPILFFESATATSLS